MATYKTQEEFYAEAKRYLSTFKLRTAEEEREYAAQWMGNSKTYEQALNDALAQLEASNKEALELRTRLTALQDLVRKDASFKPPQVGEA